MLNSINHRVEQSSTINAIWSEHCCCWLFKEAPTKYWPDQCPLTLRLANRIAIEESFNTRAVHDIINLLPNNLPAACHPRHEEIAIRSLLPWDHSQFPGVVPRTFLGALAVGLLMKVTQYIMLSHICHYSIQPSICILDQSSIQQVHYLHCTVCRYFSIWHGLIFWMSLDGCSIHKKMPANC